MPEAVHSLFQSYLMNTYYMPGMKLSIGVIVVNKKNRPFLESREKTDVEEINTSMTHLKKHRGK